MDVMREQYRKKLEIQKQREWLERNKNLQTSLVAKTSVGTSMTVPGQVQDREEEVNKTKLNESGKKMCRLLSKVGIKSNPGPPQLCILIAKT